MLQQIETVYDNGKKSLESLLREKAYAEVKDSLDENGIDINSVSDEDIETLVAAKTTDMMNAIKGFAGGALFALALSVLTGGM